MPVGQFGKVGGVDENNLSPWSFRMSQSDRDTLKARHGLGRENLILCAPDSHGAAGVRLKVDFFRQINLRAGSGYRDVFTQQGSVSGEKPRLTQAGSEKILHGITC